MQQYKDLIKDVLDNGVDSDDRTGTGTLSVFGRQVRFDLQQGFPLVTLKKTYWKGVLIELLWLLQGQTNIAFLKKHGVTIWDEWSQFDGTYPNKERLIGLVEAKRAVGDIYEGTFSTQGLKAEKGSIDDNLRSAWVKMMKRCYDKTAHNYHHYGAIGVMVRKDWHDVQNFIHDVKKLTNWENKLKKWNEYELDKDYYQSNAYSKDSCVWLHTSENNLYTRHSLPFNLKIDEKTFLCLSLSHAEEMTGIPRNTIHRWMIDGKSQKCDLKYRKLNVFFDMDDIPKKQNHSLRYLFTDGQLGPVYGKQWRDWEVPFMPGIDQIKEVIQRIKDKPNDRRLIVNAWNVAEIPNMKLPPCHCFFQFYVRNGKLSCQLYQRSADLFLGVPFNIASYALLTHLIARECNLEVGEFVHTFGDLHLYKNHLDQAREVLSREPLALSSLKLRIPQGSLMGFVDQDSKHMSWEEIQANIELIGYVSHPAIKADVSV